MCSVIGAWIVVVIDVVSISSKSPKLSTPSLVNAPATNNNDAEIRQITPPVIRIGLLAIHRLLDSSVSSYLKWWILLMASLAAFSAELMAPCILACVM